eukprot:Rhum_TRINITY_DN9710_c0_g1::Rhum_TRINITY_DN9710_c0_g1_i1::g.34784::m.34784
MANTPSIKRRARPSTAKEPHQGNMPSLHASGGAVRPATADVKRDERKADAGAAGEAAGGKAPAAGRVLGAGKCIAGIREMVQQQEMLHSRNTAISRWHARPRTATTLRTFTTPSQMLLTMQQSEMSHQASLLAWHSQCTGYRQELQKWKRDVTRGGQPPDIQFPSFAKLHK